jgi:hypothetical protein
VIRLHPDKHLVNRPRAVVAAISACLVAGTGWSVALEGMHRPDPVEVVTDVASGGATGASRRTPTTAPDGTPVPDGTTSTIGPDPTVVEGATARTGDGAAAPSDPSSRLAPTSVAGASERSVACVASVAQRGDGRSCTPGPSGGEQAGRRERVEGTVGAPPSAPRPPQQPVHAGPPPHAGPPSPPIGPPAPPVTAPPTTTPPTTAPPTTEPPPTTTPPEGPPSEPGETGGAGTRPAEPEPGTPGEG